MADEFGKIFKRVWGDPDFKSLTTSEQLLYFKLCSQSDTALSGVLTYAPVRWAMQTRELDASQVEEAISGLAAKRFVVVDFETQEVLIRSFIRNDAGWRSPRTMIAVANAVRRVLSPGLKAVIAAELERLDTSSLSSTVSEKTNRSTRDVVEEQIGYLIAEFQDADTLSNTLSGTVSHTVPDTLAPVSRTQTQTQEQYQEQEQTQKHLVPLSEKPDEPNVVAKATPQQRRGHRLPDDWQPDRTPGNLKAEDGHPADWLRRELDKFRDHWAAATGKNATKLDWNAAWRNWLRNAEDFAPKGGLNAPRTAASLTDADWQRMFERAAALDAEDERKAS